MKYLWMVPALLVSLSTFFSTDSRAQTNSWDIAVLDQALAETPPYEPLVQLGDMQVQRHLVKYWRDQLAGVPTTDLAFDGVAPKWTSGNVFYAFSNNVTAANQKAFLDATAEWATFANVHFILRSNQANYILVREDPSLGGGQATLGMVGGAQLYAIGPTAWARGVILHELGHTLGLIHEQSRSDRDGFVDILSNNIATNQAGNFVKLTNSQNQGAYDFLSVMHYARNAFSVDPNNLNTIVPKPAYMQYLNIMGAGDPVLTPSDRAGMAAVYGAGPTLTNVVTNTLDSGPGSLRAAIYYGYDHPGTTITFNIPTNDPGFASNVFTIMPTDKFPRLTNATVIDGTTGPQLNPSGPAIQLNGALTFTPSVFAHGFRFGGTNSGVRGMIINGFSGYGVLMDGSNTTGNFVSGCYLGMNLSGTSPITNGLPPVQIQAGANGNRIGGTNAAARNIISGSTYQGIVITDSGTSNNVVQGNYIGLNAAGTAALANGNTGVLIINGAKSNTIGGAVASARNVISGNTYQGVAIGGLSPSHSNTVAGNYIGLNAAGTAAVPNGYAGVDIYNGSKGNIVGGTVAGAGNVISGNLAQGVLIDSTGSDGNVILGNIVGLNPAGTAAIPNAFAGVEIYVSPQGNIIGGTVPGARNVISGNTYQGVIMNGASSNFVFGNYIGVNLAGSAAVPNGGAGVMIFSGSGNLVGGTTPSARNIISGNGNQGVLIQSTNSDNNVVLGNYIGTAPSGMAAIPNQFAGVQIAQGARNNLIGGNVPGAGNLISGNANQGVIITEAATANNSIQGNLIGLNAAGTSGLANSYSGIETYDTSSNLIGGGIGARNFISGNANYGVAITGGTANTILGNTIGLGVNGGIISNTWDGVLVESGAVSTQVGGVTPGAANIIAGNGLRGVLLLNSTTTNNAIRGNSVFSNTGGAFILFGNANHLQQTPGLSASVVSTNTVITGSLLNSAANTNFQIDFYANPPVGAIQARTYIGSLGVTTGAGGSVNFTNQVPAIVPAGLIIRATATDPAGNTSELSTGVTNVLAADSVGDGIPNAWRAAHFGGAGTTTNSQSCATCDADGDGMNTRQEFLAGTDPTNAASVLRLTAPALAGTNVTFNFPTVAGFVYRVMSKDDVTNGFWNIMEDQVIGPGGTLLITDPGAANLPKRFYRVQVFPQ